MKKCIRMGVIVLKTVIGRAGPSGAVGSVVVVVVVVLLFYVHGKHLRSCQDGQLT